METDIIEIIKSLRTCSSIKAEYQCEQCSYMVFRSITQPEMDVILRDHGIIEPLYCPTCDKESVKIIEVSSEEDWYRKYPYYMQGG